jgi:hypothetical protein
MNGIIARASPGPIKAEIGSDHGGEMPQMEKVSWTVDRADL